MSPTAIHGAQSAIYSGCPKPGFMLIRQLRNFTESRNSNSIQRLTSPDSDAALMETLIALFYSDLLTYWPDWYYWPYWPWVTKMSSMTRLTLPPTMDFWYPFPYSSVYIYTPCFHFSLLFPIPLHFPLWIIPRSFYDAILSLLVLREPEFSSLFDIGQSESLAFSATMRGPLVIGWIQGLPPYLWYYMSGLKHYFNWSVW